MKALAIQWDRNTMKTPVMPDMENVLKGIYNPLSRPLFLYVSKKAADRPEVEELVEFYLREGAALAKEVKYLPLPAKAYEIGLQRFAKRQVGTAYGGVPEVGLTVEEILRRTPLTEAKVGDKATGQPAPPSGRK
jgi:phosphate transport system substrate-binding protein